MSHISLKICEIKEKVNSDKEAQSWTVALLNFKSDQLARNCVVVCPNNKLWTSNFSSDSLLHVYSSEKHDGINKYIFGTVSHEKSYEIDVSEEYQRHLVTEIISKFVGTKERTIELLKVLTEGTLDFEPYKPLEIPTTNHERKVKNWGAWS